MVYLEYHKQTKQVVEIHNTIPTVTDDYDYAKSEQFEVGDEFELTIWVNEVTGGEVVSYSAIRNNPNAKRLLQENVELKNDLSLTNRMLSESYASHEALIELLIDMGVL